MVLILVIRDNTVDLWVLIVLIIIKNKSIG
jgi:hypothetical protein